MQKIEFPLPITINKFMEFKPIDTTTFQKQWRSLKINCLMSEPLPLDRHILMITDDLIRYFPFITDISPKILNRSFDFIEKNNKNSKGNFKKTNSKKTFKANQRKWGGMFTINGLKDFLIRIRIIEDYYICFEVGDRDQNDEFSKKIIETLCFIFCQN